MLQTVRTSKMLSMGWIDYKKAYDMVPHLWLKEGMELIRLEGKIIGFLSDRKERWRTILMANNQIFGKVNKEGYLSRSYSFPITFCHSTDTIICDTSGNGMWIPVSIA